MRVTRGSCRGCVFSDGRFADLGGCTGVMVMKYNMNTSRTSSCEALAVGDNEQCSPIHVASLEFTCAAVAKCIIVAVGLHLITAEVFDEVFGRWLRLPFDLPNHAPLKVCWVLVGPLLWELTHVGCTRL
jgi:hypothetical protein